MSAIRNSHLKTPRTLNEAYGSGAYLQTDRDTTVSKALRSLALIGGVVAVIALCTGCESDVALENAMASEVDYAIADARLMHAEYLEQEREEFMKEQHAKAEAALDRINVTYAINTTWTAE